MLLRFGQPPLRELGRTRRDMHIVDEVARRAHDQHVEMLRNLLDEAVDKLAARIGH